MEGVIKYQLVFDTGIGPLAWDQLAELDSWRTLLFRIGLNGRDPARYEGLAYGNVSRRLGGRKFVISGTQTGGKPRLEASDYCLVSNFDIGSNALWAGGPIQPSSEALTHAAAYEAGRRVNFVFHVHSPELWVLSPRLSIPVTDPGIAYGTPEMAAAIGALLQRPEADLIAMGGHLDGLIAVGGTPEAAANALFRALTKAFALAPRGDN